MAIRVRHR